MKKINIAELLKDCPEGMELDCTIFDTKVIYQGLSERMPTHPIVVQTEHGFEFELTQYGQTHNIVGSKCIIFPKGKTTWEGFQRPFEDGDVIFTHGNCLKVGLGNTWISIYKENRNGGVATYVDYAEDGSDYYSDLDGDKGFLCMESDILRQRLATEEEKQRLFQAIKDNGYNWNAETKTLEKLIEPRFKVGAMIQDVDKYKVRITEVNLEDECYGYESLISKGIGGIAFSEQDNWELIPNKFDITTLKPFDKVLVRNTNKDFWRISMFGYISKGDKQYFMCIANSGFYQCVPYENNEHLLGTTDNCDEFYKTW